MDLHDKYSAELNQIKGFPDFNKRRAIKRFFLIHDFQDNYFPAQKLLFGARHSQTKAMGAYCELRGVAKRTFLRWFVDYRTHGIKGLVPKYRARRKMSNVSIRYRKNKLLATLAIDTRNPLKCLETLRRIIERCRTIEPEVKNKSLSLMSRYFESAFHEHQLSLNAPLTGDEIKALNRYIAGNHKKYCRKAAAILLANKGRTLLEVIEATHVSKRTVYRWLRDFNKDRLDSIKVRIHAPAREAKKAERETKVIAIIHKMPSLFGINRTTWTYGKIAEVYQREHGAYLSIGMVQGIVKSTGYRWRHARMVLTSPDPDYVPKIMRVLKVVQGLKGDERFFFIDEVGPYRVKKYGGRKLSLEGQIETIAAQQKGRGKVQFVAALEAVTNQLSWRFTEDKSAISMISFLEKLVASFDHCPNIYMTWDAMSVHTSKAVVGWISAHNDAAKAPHIEVVPLPSRAQFLNVIESHFGLMKKAVIANSDYAGPREMQEAIAGYFEERNQHFRDHPKHAGDKIWRLQAFDIDKFIGGLFKKM